MTTPPMTDEVRFSETVRKVTWSDHQGARSTSYVHQLFRGELSREEYAAMVVQHHAVYAALEAAALTAAGDPVVARFVRPEVLRVPALEADLVELFGADWASAVTPLPSTERYVARIEEVCATSSTAFLAHHYTRYLGDLSGGQMIGAAVARTYGFGDGPGAKFYAFDDIADPKAFKDEYRTMLDELAWDEAQRDAMVTEVAVAYRLNSDVLAELGEHTGVTAEG